MKYSLVVQQKERHIVSYHVAKKPINKKINFQYSKVQVSKRILTEKFKFLVCFETDRSVDNAEILAPELVGEGV